MRASELDHRKKNRMVQQGVISGKEDPRNRGRDNGPPAKNSKRKQERSKSDEGDLQSPTRISSSESINFTG